MLFGDQVTTLYIPVGITLGLLLVSIVVLTWLGIGDPGPRARRLLRKGARATAYVRAAKPLSSKPGDRRLYVLDLEIGGVGSTDVDPGRGRPDTDAGRYTITIKDVLDREASAWAVPGRVLSVRVDPRRPHRVLIHWPDTLIGPRPTPRVAKVPLG